MWPGERMDRAELEWDVEEVEDRVARRKRASGVDQCGRIIYERSGCGRHPQSRWNNWKRVQEC